MILIGINELSCCFIAFNIFCIGDADSKTEKTTEITPVNKEEILKKSHEFNNNKKTAKSFIFY